MKLTGAQILMKCLEREGVKHIFGYPGGVVLDIYDELARTPNIMHILVRHEQAAVHAADGCRQGEFDRGAVPAGYGSGVAVDLLRESDGRAGRGRPGGEQARRRP